MPEPTTDQLRNEDRITWLEPPERMPYVRELVVPYSKRRRGPIGRSHVPGRLVGYAELRPDAPNNGRPGVFTRRAFWLATHDRTEKPDSPYLTGCPSEGVDPLTVAPGVAGELTRRAWGCDNAPDEPHHAGGACSLCGRTWPAATDA